MPLVRNLFEDLPVSVPEEMIDTLVENDSVRIERIVSTGHRSDDDFWYDCDQHEWVMVLQGEAELMFADQSETIPLSPGACVNIAAHCRHRVHYTSLTEPTVWLAVYYGNGPFA